MEIEAPHRMQEMGYHKAHDCHQCYSALPAVEYLKSFCRVVAMLVIARGHLI
jgi:hypothetical protein